MYETRNDLPEATRARVLDVLAPRLADLIDLQLQSKQAHWNVKGPTFIALHELFDEVGEAAEEYVDLVAERIVQLGGVALGTIQAVAKSTKLPPYPTDIGEGLAHVHALSAAIAATGRRSREAIDMLDELGDRDSSDIFTQVSRGLDKWLWFVEAHGQTQMAEKARQPEKRRKAG